jgi:phospholipid/cholesterol/gamma-HCH transport system permease protein
MFRDLYYTLFEFVRTFGALQLFFLRLLMHTPTVLSRRFGLVIGQVYNAGALSLVIIVICGFFVGAVLGLQGFSNLARFNAEDSVGAVAALALVKELGPVITALLFMMAVNPIRRVVVPRFLGGVVAMPLLAAVFSMVGLLGAHLVCVSLLGVDVGSFWQQMQQSVEVADINEGIVKSVVFGIAASLLAVWEGYNAIPTAEGVGRATTRTVVLTAIVVLIFDFMITAVAI